jgi:hypothetical protein
MRDWTSRLAVVAAVFAVMLCCIGGPIASANDYFLLGSVKYDLLGDSDGNVIVTPPAVKFSPTATNAEVANKWFPAPATDEQLVMLKAGGWGAGTAITRSRTVTSSVASYSALRRPAAPVRRVFGRLFRGRLCAMGSCY